MFHLSHLDGSSSRGDLSSLPDLLDELDGADIEHPDVAVHHESGVSASVFTSGRVVVEDVEEDSFEPEHAIVHSRADVLEIITAVANGDVRAAKQGHVWSSGYGP